MFNSKRICYKRRRTQRCPLKRRRHFDKRSIYYGAVRGEYHTSDFDQNDIQAEEFNVLFNLPEGCSFDF